ncbi:beta-1,3-glucan-binding protein-like [Microplitis mediator]|uniref:beta-1,3-glucan-binding protein-like n=1 Tax=Microplitis mediator TaxID=375433 RepID=UPI0025521273|nr:beta-1,3-glucan-binding protein-like [Microplitis mediator]
MEYKKYIIVNLLVIFCGDTLAKCDDSSTTVNGIKVKCKNELILEENFNRIAVDEYYAEEDNYIYLNSSLWKKEIKIPLDPDYEFCVYHKLEKGLRVENGFLKIIPSLLEDSYGENITYFGRLQLADCTGILPGECSRQATGFHILPPVLSRRLTTKDSFSFRYGKIEIRAKFPEGDWIYPEMWLAPKYTTSGVGYASGRIILGMARGNEGLIKNDGSLEDYSSNILEFGLRTGPLGTSGNVTEEKVTKRSNSGPWTRGFHTYTTIWNPDGFIFKVDGELVGQLRSSRQSEDQNRMAPYDLEFYLMLGVGVGGIRVFPDGTRTGNYEKPWKNVGAKAMLRFWQAKDQWLPSWKRENARKTAFEVDYIKVWSV